MTKKVILFAALLLVNFLAFAAQPTFMFTDILLKDAARTYGFVKGQEFRLNLIAKKHPSLELTVKQAKLKFSSEFGGSISLLESYMKEKTPKKWAEVKSKIEGALPALITPDETEVGAQGFIQEVINRAEGKIPSRTLKTLLMFHPRYFKRPELELAEGYKQSYTSTGNPKSKDVDFYIEVPESWDAKSASSPNVVQQFTSENGRGLEVVNVLVKDIPLGPDESITKTTVEEWANPQDLKDFIPKRGKFIDGGYMTLENLPGLWVRYDVSRSRVRTELEMEGLAYFVFYKNKIITINTMITTHANGEKIERVGLDKFEKLSDLIANSFKVLNLY